MTTGQVIISRRAIMTGLTSGAGLLLAGCPDTQPPNYGNVLRMAGIEVMSRRSYSLASACLGSNRRCAR